MHILVAGGSGFLGRALTSALLGAGNNVTILTRSPNRTRSAAAGNTPQPRFVSWSPDDPPDTWSTACAHVDAVINLAGASIGARRWSAARKVELITSRLKPTRALVRFIEGATTRPSAFISASAVGYYGDRGNEDLEEDACGGTDFLAELAFEWEQEALKAASSETRVVLVRTGIVLDPREGALAKMLPPFKLGAGGPFGSGRQCMSWIHRDDWVSMARWLVETPGLSGAFNVTAPHPVTNREFATTLGRVLRRPALLPAPGLALRILLGEMAGPLLLASQRARPDRALRAGFDFRFPALEPALRNLLA